VHFERSERQVEVLSSEKERERRKSGNVLEIKEYGLRNPVSRYGETKLGPGFIQNGTLFPIGSSQK
jgi:hypothetical protein